MFKFKFHFTAIGDQIATTALPENIFKLTGQRIAITDARIWAFKHNPYVDFMTDDQAKDLDTIDLIPDCRVPQQRQNYFDRRENTTTNGQTDYMLSQLAIDKFPLRHSRLYVYEDETIEPDKVVVHTQGSDRTQAGEPAIRYSSGEDSERIMTDDVCNAILKNYRDYKIIQIGAKTDRPLGGKSIDLRGKTDYWNTAREIATASKFIGVNSGPMHIANCYPRVDKRIVLMEFPNETITKFRPGDIRNWLFSWIDPTATYFNKTEVDSAYTYSYTKI